MIVVSGNQFKTLDDDIFVDGEKVVEAYANGELVYPEGFPYTIKYRQIMSCQALHPTAPMYGGFSKSAHWEMDSTVRINSRYPITLDRVVKSLPPSETFPDGAYDINVERAGAPFTIYAIKLPYISDGSYSYRYESYTSYEVVWYTVFRYNVTYPRYEPSERTYVYKGHGPAYCRKWVQFAVYDKGVDDFLDMRTLDIDEDHRDCLSIFPVHRVPCESFRNYWMFRGLPGKYFGAQGFYLFNVEESYFNPIFDGSFSTSIIDTHRSSGSIHDRISIAMQSRVMILENNNTIII